MRYGPLLTLALAACSTPRPAIILPPAELTTCAGEPSAPDLPAQNWTAPVDAIRALQRTRDELTLAYVLGMRSAWGDCAAKVAGVKAWRETAGK